MHPHVTCPHRVADHVADVAGVRGERSAEHLATWNNAMILNILLIYRAIGTTLEVCVCACACACECGWVVVVCMCVCVCVGGGGGGTGGSVNLWWLTENI